MEDVYELSGGYNGECLMAERLVSLKGFIATPFGDLDKVIVTGESIQFYDGDTVILKYVVRGGILEKRCTP